MVVIRKKCTFAYQKVPFGDVERAFSVTEPAFNVFECPFNDVEQNFYQGINTFIFRYEYNYDEEQSSLLLTVMAVSIWSDNNLNKKGIGMAKYKLQELTDMRNEGKRRVYPKIVTNRTLSRKEFIKRMQSYHRGISESTTEAVLLDVADMLVEMLSMGYNVNIEGIGTFSLSLGFEDDKPTEMQSEDDKMTYRKVGVKDINFKASPEFLKSVKHKTDRDLERDMGGVKVIRKQLYSREERIARALEVIETNGLITLSDYACINNLSRTAASLELKEITASRTSPIDSTGSGSHKVWVKRKE